MDLILILGDQLSPQLSSLAGSQPEGAEILMAEVQAEAQYVPHHRKKIAFSFAAMRHFRQELQDLGWRVHYRAYDPSHPCPDLAQAVADRLAEATYERLIITEPGEWRLRQEMETWSERFDLPVSIVEDTRFLASHADFEHWAEGRKQLRMEYFYREMRHKTGLLMAGDKPEGGKWNYDAENRKPAEASLLMPKRLTFQTDTTTRDVLDLVSSGFDHAVGDLTPFQLAVTRQQAEQARDHFFAHGLALFGDYQDAMLSGEAFLWHSLLSTYLNAGLLDPLDLCRRAEAEFRAGRAPLNAVEGYIRQILGWREYVRGIYWREGPDYVKRNALNAKRALPDFYWTGETEMLCLSEAIGQTLKEGYAHHIQRLMVTGTFALLAGVDPHQVHEWYLAVYTDAYEWVEGPNVIGMSQFADGGLLGSKPYAASGAYIDRMSDYCGQCRYDVKDKTGENSCPFNSLYWDFLDRNQDRLRGNPRLGPVYRNWDRMDDTKQDAYRQRAAKTLKSLD